MQDALISADGLYRYWLSRDWFGGQGRTAFVMLNPSTADASQDDPTIRRCIGFAKRLGRAGLIVVNLFAARSTDPDMLGIFDDPVGPENDQHIAKAAQQAEEVICGWGAHSAARQRARNVQAIIRAAGRYPMCLGVTKDNAPRHPLYLRSDARPIVWAPFDA